MKRIFAVSVLMVLFCLPGISSGCDDTRIGSYPLPLVESEMLLTRWLQQERYSVSSHRLANGDVELVGSASGKRIKVSIRAHSSLATELELLESPGKETVAALRSSWEAYLAKSGLAEGVAIPDAITSLAAAVVCISAPPDDTNKMNFSGFLIDQVGTILTIAHDIDDRRVFRLLFPDGVVGEGRIMKSDVARDLSVMLSNHRGYNTYFALKEGRTKLKIGDRIFMLCCSSSGSVQVQAGSVDKPKANVGGQPLWQVKLEQVFFGSSGSPVVDENGRLVGVVKGRFRGTDSRGFLIPLDTVRAFVGVGGK